MMSIKKWDRFSKWLSDKSELLEWVVWFEVVKKKECDIRKNGHLYALFVNQQWSEEE